MHGSFDRPSEFDGTKIVLPTFKRTEARAAAVGPDGGDSFVDKSVSAFLVLNRCHEAAIASARLETGATTLEREVSRVQRKLDWTPGTVPGTSKGTPIARLNVAFAIIFGLATVLSIGISVRVVSEYALESASPVFNSLTSAVVFGLIPTIAALSVKSLEMRLTERARGLVLATLAALGLSAFVVFLASAALSLAPETGSASLGLIEGDSGRLVASRLLVCSTVISDFCFSTILMSAATHWLTDRPSDRQIPNPAHVALEEEKRVLEEKLVACQREHEKVRDYLHRVEAGRALTRHLAEFEINRAREQFNEGQLAARAFFTALFLSTED